MCPLTRQIRCGILAILLLGFAISPAMAQNSPPAAAPKVLPPNVSAPARYYVMEGIVVVVLFGAAIFGVCRASGRT